MENFLKVSANKFAVNPFYSVSFLGYTMQSGSKYNGIDLQTLQDNVLILLLENIIRVVLGSVMDDK